MRTAYVGIAGHIVHPSGSSVSRGRLQAEIYDLLMSRGLADTGQGEIVETCSRSYLILTPYGQARVPLRFSRDLPRSISARVRPPFIKELPRTTFFATIWDEASNIGSSSSRSCAVTVILEFCSAAGCVIDKQLAGASKNEDARLSPDPYLDRGHEEMLTNRRVQLRKPSTCRAAR